MIDPVKTLVYLPSEINWLVGPDFRQRTMRHLVPVPGDSWYAWVDVVIRHGESRSRHSHLEWAALYYEQPGDPPAALVVVSDDGVKQRIEPQLGMVVVMPPNTQHYVEPSESWVHRVSHALLVTP